ncbi:MAG: SDR family oxidoreductase [Elusimicrobia bacterium]|nr:SDR family oxidoreductase [Elusimicrobiota bacterium]
MKGNILITGGTGLLGRGVISTAPDEVEIISVHLRNYPAQNPRAKTFLLDVLNKQAVNELFEKYGFSAVVHCAGAANVDYVEKNYAESLESNVSGAVHIAEACKMAGAHLIYVSTNAVFDGENAPYDEKSPLNPVNKYGHMKVECEKVVAETLQNFTIARPILMYGWNDPHARQNPVTWLLEKLKTGQSANMVNDVWENPIYNVECGCAVWEIIRRKFFGAIHLAGGEIVNRYQFALKVAEVFGLNAGLIKEVNSSYFPQIAPRPKNTSFKTEVMEKHLSVKPISVREGLMRMKAEIK